MNFLFNSDIMHGGGFWTITEGLIFSLLYLGVMGALWYVYYIKFEDKPGFAKAPNDNTWNWIYKFSTVGIIAIIAFFIFFIGWKKVEPSENPTNEEAQNCFKSIITSNSSWERISYYGITPLAWLTTGFLAALVASKTSKEDIDELYNRGKAAVDAVKTEPTPKTK